MTISDEKLFDFFQKEILDLDEDDVDIFLSNYSKEEVKRCLIQELRSISCDGERSWKLGKTFGSVTSNYYDDVEIHSALNDATLAEKKSLLIFLSGYWENKEADVDVIIKIAEEIINLIKYPDNHQWDTWSITLAIGAVAVGYFYNKKLFEIPEKDNFKKTLIILKAYVADVSPTSSAYQLLSNKF